MIYVYECRDHGCFEQREPMLQEHRASCAECGASARRIYTFQGMIYAYQLFNRDGSYDNDLIRV